MHRADVSISRSLAAIFTLGALAHSVAAQTNPAMSDPDSFMWEVFVEISRPAENGTNDVVWETWALPQDLFGDPNSTPEWPSLEAQRLKVLESDLVQQQLLRHHLRQSAGLPSEAVPEFLAGRSSEVRLNQPFFDFVVDQKLWYIQGQEAAFVRGEPVDAPTESKEIKAVWRPISESEKSRYHWQPYLGQVYGLVALHIITKDIPAWTWATWEHADNPDLCVVHPCRDSFGRTATGEVSEELKQLFAAAGMGDHWHQYRLVGTQVNYTDLIGRPIILGNSIIEGGFVASSSCMTCHVRSTIGPPIAGLGGANRLSVFPPELGAPSPDWFLNSSTNPPTRKYLPLDFVWTFSRAKPRTVP